MSRSNDITRKPASVVSISVTALGVRAEADGRTGREAWRIIHRRHPRLTAAAAGYGLLLGSLVVVAVIRLIA
ncbi:hypothetical protein ACWD5R_32130 [Streptomyces sp. NPDC002514]|uniref:hypothetical protein n=1 Tax=Streptomyces sp. NPDC001270 TaxID=3364554 RepID=UPI003691B488